MARAFAWFRGNDMLVELRKLRSSTMAAGSYLTNSGGVSVDVWGATTTENVTDFQVSKAMPYVGSSGWYRVQIDSTDHSMTQGTNGLAIITVAHGALDGQWRVPFRVDDRRST